MSWGLIWCIQAINWTLQGSKGRFQLQQCLVGKTRLCGIIGSIITPNNNHTLLSTYDNMWHVYHTATLHCHATLQLMWKPTSCGFAIPQIATAAGHQLLQAMVAFCPDLGGRRVFFCPDAYSIWWAGHISLLTSTLLSRSLNVPFDRPASFTIDHIPIPPYPPVLHRWVCAPRICTEVQLSYKWT